MNGRRLAGGGEGVATTPRRIGAEGSATRALMLDMTEALMREEGYAAVSTRRVAARAGVKAPLVHYYFPTTDDLLLAVYRRAAEKNHERLTEALSSKHPLRALWELSNDPARTTLIMEFMALANHRKVIKAELARSAAHFRAIQAEALERALHGAIDPAVCTPLGVTVLVAGLSRVLVTEEALGVSSGHADIRAFVEWLLDRIESGEGKPVGAP